MTHTLASIKFAVWCDDCSGGGYEPYCIVNTLEEAEREKKQHDKWHRK
jgi:chemotaxis methyl-accepting protein methylase